MTNQGRRQTEFHRVFATWAVETPRAAAKEAEAMPAMPAPITSSGQSMVPGWAMSIQSFALCKHKSCPGLFPSTQPARTHCGTGTFPLTAYAPLTSW
jgi:hypothetical protein